MGLPLDAKQLRPQVLWEENSLSLLALWVFSQKKKKCARAVASGELPTWPVPGLFIKTTTQQLGSTSTLICSMSIAIVVGHVFQLLVCCCYCPLHLTWTFGAGLSKSWQRTTSRLFKRFHLTLRHSGVGLAKTLPYIFSPLYVRLLLSHILARLTRPPNDFETNSRWPLALALATLIKARSYCLVWHTKRNMCMYIRNTAHQAD